ncbi:hypothetical protein A3B32_00220 [Candidatus Uhrbacteria bacterium RIFCSPLOWO2_01_FULL_53_9]|uniref:Sulfatase N-terminal domain-containing protein n=2 Tax=Candidatus Uhriibacteriota TaxID=1752732 RepID=A0A1F7UWM2_9BACT|nr:MAG: hypothetical protein A3C17_02220 [Candidatus Uhrbacteria bacterium RIFCSPHIGHO2_02_FULL_53_13]OGL82675.1 MAG: hypothetical protein A3B32_00220 [Candidatus Uhrbacteria bacterium RIFCSPLOWO2_01_FULL_53_9]
MQKAPALKSYLSFSAQVFLAFSVVWVLGFLYRWDSLRTSLSVQEVAIAFFSFLPIFALLILFGSLPLLFGLLIVRTINPAWQNALIAVARVAIVIPISYVVFRFLYFWGDKIDNASTDRVKMMFFVVLVCLFIAFFVLTWANLSGKFKTLDRTQRIALLLISFILTILIFGLTSAVIENRLTYKLVPAFFQYGFWFLPLFFLMYWREYARALSHVRVAMIPSAILFLVSSTVLGFAYSAKTSDVYTAPERAASPKPYDVQNVILISFDALPAERMSLYGNPRPTTPNFERLARSSYVFDRAHANADQTHLSIPSIHTGLLPYSTRLSRVGRYFAGGNIVGYMPTVLKTNGFETAYMLYRPYEGIDDIFRRVLRYNDAQPEFLDGYYGSSTRRTLEIVAQTYPFLPAHVVEGLFSDFFGQHEFDWALDSSDPPGSTKFNLAKDYMSHYAPDRFFLWVHQLPTHDGYGRYVGFEGMFLESLVTPQAVEDALEWKGPPYAPEKEPLVEEFKLIFEEYLAATDDEFGRFLDYLEEQGLMENSMIIVFSDHGEAFSKGELYHGTGLMYEQTLHVPLLIHMPGQTEGTRVSELAQLADIAPTILDALGYVSPLWMDGISLLPSMERADQALPPETRTTFSQTIPGVTRLTNVDVLKALYTFVVYRGDHKMIYRFFADYDLNEIPIEEGSYAERFFVSYPQAELFNVAQDPQEQDNLMDREPELAAELMILIQGQMEKTKAFREQIPH